MHVRKEALQNRNLIQMKDPYESFFRYIDIEINFYKDKQKIENEAVKQKTTIESPDAKPQKDTIRLHWQSDDVLIPYLMEQLFQEGFINNSDFELRRDFIEQSFYKKNGSIYNAKEAGTAESNYKINKNEKPRNAHKVDRIIDNLISKREEIIDKNKSVKKKK